MSTRDGEQSNKESPHGLRPREGDPLPDLDWLAIPVEIALIIEGKQADTVYGDRA